MSLWVIIPSKSPGNFRTCVSAVRQHEPSAKIILIDDKGQAGANLDCDDRIETSGHFSFPRAANLGMRRAIECGAESFVLLNDDAILKTPAGFSILEAAIKDPHIGIISATTNLVGNSKQRPQKTGLRYEPKDVAFICVLIPRRTIDRVGYMDERFGGITPEGRIIYGCCDTDYCRQLQNAGLTIAVHDGCFVDHATLPSSFAKDCRRNTKVAREIYRKKWGE